MKYRFTGYAHSAGLPDARKAIAGYATRNGTSTTPNEVIITSGASEAADLVLTALLDPEDEVLVPAPGYPLYPAILSKLGAVPKYYRLNANNDWKPSVDEMALLVTRKTKAIVLINPNNPTGSITPDQITTEIMQLADALNLLVISDEVYRDLCFVGQSSPASVLAAGFNCPVVTLESLSKTHMLSGWRVGCCVLAAPAKWAA
jgi:alanine-synthesizing transaminase